MNKSTEILRFGERISRKTSESQADKLAQRSGKIIRTALEVPESLNSEQELREALDARVVGQSEAKQKIIDAITSSVYGFTPRKGPIATLFFSGPTGVGKTEIVKALSEALLGNDGFFTKINCNEYQEHHTTRNLFGAPKSYLGYRDKTPLDPEKVMGYYDAAKKGKKLHKLVKNLDGFSIILFDEIEKAHPEVHQSLLTLLDEGKVTFTNEQTANFGNAIIIMTSNIGQHELAKSKSSGIGFTEVCSSGDEKEVDKAIKKSFSPEFIGRIDEFVQFHELSENDAKKILLHSIEKTNYHLQKYYKMCDFRLEISDAGIQTLLKQGYSKEKGARELSRVYEKYIHTALAKIFHTRDFEPFFSIEEPVTIYIDSNENGELSYEIEYFLEDGKSLEDLLTDDIELEEEGQSELDKYNEKSQLIKKFIATLKLDLNTPDHDFSNDVLELELELLDLGFSEKDINQLQLVAKSHTINSYFPEDLGTLNIFSQNKLELFSPYNERVIETIVKTKMKSILEEMHELHNWSDEMKSTMMIAYIYDEVEKLIGFKLSYKQQEKIILFMKKNM